MKTQTKLIITTLAIMAGLVFVPFATANAVDVFGGACGAAGGTTGGSEICGAASDDDFYTIIKNVINVMLLVLGMVAVIMIIIGGIRYATSNGDQNQIKSAKDTVLYSVIGLIVAIFSFAIVNFVIDAFTDGNGGTGGTGNNNGGAIPATNNPGSGVTGP